MPVSDKDVENLMKVFTPQQQALVRAMAEDRVQNKLYERQLAELKKQYDDLWKVMIVILHAQPANTLRIHETQFLRFKEEYRLDRTFDNETKEVVLRLLTLRD